jgi:hypothetical protein
MGIVPADAASDEVWSFLTLVVAPDVAVWRFPGRADDRLLGRPRNVFRRLWWRGQVLGNDFIDERDGLGEDELVGIMERSTIAANPRLARALAHVVVEYGTRVNVARSDLMRDVAKRVLRLQSVLCMEILDDERVDDLVFHCFQQTRDAMARDAASRRVNR